MSDQIDASTQHDVVDSSESTVPTKHSLRIPEPGSSNRVTREEDLANGPLLLGLGDGQEDPVNSHPELYLSYQYSGHHRPEESVLPSMPLRLPEALATGPMTSSTISQSGPTYSVLTQTESITSANQSLPLTTENISSATQSLLAELTERSAIRDRGVFPFSHSYEFSWHDSSLCFGGEPLEVARAPDDGFSKVNPGSERALTQLHEPTTGATSLDVLADEFVSLGVAGIGGSIEHMSFTILREDLEVASTMSSVLGSTSSSMDSDATTEPSDPNLLIAMHKCADWAVELLMDDYFRSCAPQASKGRATGASHNAIQHASDNRESESRGVNGKARAGPNSRKRKAVGGDGSDDEDSPDKKRKSYGTGKDKKPLHWACPFVKWKPKKYSCTVAPTQFRGIKDHIRKTHWIPHCEVCWSEYSTSEDEVRHRICSKIYRRSDPPAGLVTEKMRLEILVPGNKACSGLSHEDQWHKFYSVLFPGEPRCLSPYVNEEKSDYMDRAEVRFRSPQSQEIFDEVISEFGFGGNEHKKVMNMIREKYLARMFQEHDLNYQYFCTPVSHEPQEIETIQSSHIDVHGTEGTTTEFDPLQQGFSGLSAGEASVFDPGPLTVYFPVENTSPSAMLGPSGLENPLDSVAPEGVGLYQSEIVGMSFDDNPENSFSYGWMETS